MSMAPELSPPPFFHPTKGSAPLCPQLTLDGDLFDCHCLDVGSRDQPYTALISAWVEVGFRCSAQQCSQLVIRRAPCLLWEVIGDSPGIPTTA